MTETTNYSVTLPVVGADADQWGGILNTGLDQLDGIVFGIQQSVDAKADLAGAAFTGAITGTAGTFTGDVVAGNFIGSLAGTATAWETPRTITLEGVATGAVAIDGTGDVTLSVAIADGALGFAKVNGLVTALQSKENLLNADQKRVITAGAAEVGPSLATGAIYLQYET